jgi:hypothetical protein
MEGVMAPESTASMAIRAIAGLARMGARGTWDQLLELGRWCESNVPRKILADLLDKLDAMEKEKNGNDNATRA